MDPISTSLSPNAITGLPAIVWNWTMLFAPRVLAAVVIIAAGLALSRWIRGLIVRLTEHSQRFDPTLRPVLLAAVQYTIIVLLLILVLNQLGIQTTSLLAVLGAAGLAIGLALQGTLTNIAAGIMLLWLRPFRPGDYIEVNNMAGKVEELGLFVCTIRTYDGARLFAPNATLWNFSLRNDTEAPSRMIAVNVTVSASGEQRARNILDKVLASVPAVQKQPAPLIFLDQATDATVTLTARFWAKAADYGELQRGAVETIRTRLIADGMAPEDIKLVARVTPAPADPTRLIDL